MHETAMLTGEDPGDLHDRAINLPAETVEDARSRLKGLEDYAFSMANCKDCAGASTNPKIERKEA